MNIPGNEKIAEVYNKGALADQTREDTQQFRREESAATRAQQAELKHEQLRQDNLRLAELNRSNKVNEEEKAANHRAMEANVAQMNQWRHEDNQAKAAAAAESAKAKGLKPVPQKVVADLTSLANQVDNIEAVTSSFDDSYAGRTGQAMNLAGKVSPWGTEATNWWKDYEKRAALVERHDTFGTALSAGEQTAWKNATIEPGMPAETVRHNLEVRQELARKMYDNALVRQNNASAGQYNVLDVFQPRSNTASATPSGTSIPSPSLKVYTPLRRAVAATQPAPMKTQTINGVTYMFDGKGWKPQ
jgi:flagellar biosynthesis GTPase FlhF